MGDARTALLKDNAHPSQAELSTAAAQDGEAFYYDGTDATKPEGFSLVNGAWVADEDDTDADAETAEAGEYDEWQGSELRDELRRRELPVSGNNDELRQRLTDDDAGTE